MIEIDALTKDYLELTVVDHVSMKIDDGDICVIVGTSGSGKTTLLRMINRLIEPTSGSVKIDGRDTRSVPAHLLRREIGYAIQGHGLFPHRTVGQNISTVPVLMGWDKARIDRRVEELLDLFQLPAVQFRDRLPSELSGGQQQRVGVARALMAEPALVLADEPVASVDPETAKAVLGVLAAHRARTVASVICALHQPELACAFADRIVVLEAGRVVFDGPPAGYRQVHAVQAAA